MNKAALIVVDVQNDFCPGGALAVADGDAVVPVLNTLMDLFAQRDLPVAVTRDWHPSESRHFETHGGPWPVHCVQETAGAAFHPGLVVTDRVRIFDKGVDPDRDGYSGFQGHDAQGTALPDFLSREGVDAVFVGGLATDYCVKNTVLDACRRDWAVYVLVDAVRAVDRESGDGARALTAMRATGAVLVRSADVAGMLTPAA